MNQRFLFATLLFLSLSVSVLAQQNATYLKYIEQYAPLAVNEQKEHGIPASITLAQGLLESGAGNSELARNSNNHFGIKCGGDWRGAKVYHDDDRRGECFRKYKKVSESYHDHSLFLKRTRYQSLFSLKPTDYKGWAHGLKKAGYATDPKYAYKLIDIIEKYNLDRFDKGESRKSWKKKKETIVVPKTTSDKIVELTYVPDGVSVGATFAYFEHRVRRNNRVKCVKSEVGDTYFTIADEFGISEKEILYYNDLVEDKTFNVAGKYVYLSWKKKKARRTFHIVRENESAHDVAQLYGIKLSVLYDLNNIPYTEGVRFGQKLRLK